MGENMADYANPNKLFWYYDVECCSCGKSPVNSWDKRCSRALGYKAICCEDCLAQEYGVTVQELRDTMREHFGMIPCPGI